MTTLRKALFLSKKRGFFVGSQKGVLEVNLTYAHQLT